MIYIATALPAFYAMCMLGNYFYARMAYLPVMDESDDLFSMLHVKFYDNYKKAINNYSKYSQHEKKIRLMSYNTMHPRCSFVIQHYNLVKLKTQELIKNNVTITRHECLTYCFSNRINVSPDFRLTAHCKEKVIHQLVKHHINDEQVNNLFTRSRAFLPV